MEKDAKILKGLYTKRISLYEDLLGCIKRESDNLINQNIKGIWSSLDEKKEILEAIEENTACFPENSGANPIPDDVSRHDRDTIMQFKKRLSDLKQEISARVRENVSFINETLGFINDIFSSLSNADKKPDTYGRNLKKRNNPSNLIYYNEV
ncbi:MAG: flagellar export chaperone FlgN [Deltaproteobacteria bacterium]|nr:flagellar export chaperone FlgN [Deltaproteobacteria bacterium]